MSVSRIYSRAATVSAGPAIAKYLAMPPTLRRTGLRRHLREEGLRRTRDTDPPVGTDSNITHEIQKARTLPLEGVEVASTLPAARTTAWKAKMALLSLARPTFGKTCARGTLKLPLEISKSSLVRA